jgi:hypothetical protein
MLHEPALWSSSPTSVKRISSWIWTSSMFHYDILTSTQEPQEHLITQLITCINVYWTWTATIATIGNCVLSAGNITTVRHERLWKARGISMLLFGNMAAVWRHGSITAAISTHSRFIIMPAPRQRSIKWHATISPLFGYSTPPPQRVYIKNVKKR